MAQSFEDRIKQAVQIEQKQIADRSDREQVRRTASNRGLSAASAFAGVIIAEIVKPRMYAARQVLPDGASVSVGADQNSRHASLTAPVRPGANACINIAVRFDHSDNVSLEASLTRPNDETGKRMDAAQPRVQKFKVADGERPAIEEWIEGQLIGLVPQLLRACS
jgi:hypothetical protein